MAQKLIVMGDWGLGLGDWAQAPIPNPQSPTGYIKKNLSDISISIFKMKIYKMFF
jgi:hypothetical protein